MLLQLLRASDPSQPFGLATQMLQAPPRSGYGISVLFVPIADRVDQSVNLRLR